ncbi:MAG TPA: hypothetical protein VK589_03965 [Chryseolinea sp.]|nr:hypothetical protein [Chryseolinea sp.]
MKKVSCLLFVLSFVSMMILSCSKNQQEVDPAQKREEAKNLYKKNLANVKAAIKAFEEEDVDKWSTYVADSAVYVPAAYGLPWGTKQDWINTLIYFTSDWDSIKLKNSVFLPSLDTSSFEFDGSVRYYGQWKGIHKLGKKTQINYYAYYKFNKANKITFAIEFFDVGGLTNAVAPRMTSSR